MYSGTAFLTHCVLLDDSCTILNKGKFAKCRPTTTGAVLGRQNTSSEQPPPNMAAANFVVITNGEGCALNRTAVAAVLINQWRAACFLSASCDWL